MALKAFCISLVFLAGVAAAVHLRFLPGIVLWIYLAFSLLSLLLYAKDKWAARRGGWRTPEKTLHLFAFAGGWPGALYAQQLLRHKSAKRSFRQMFWLTVVLNLCVLAYLASPQATPYRSMIGSWENQVREGFAEIRRQVNL